MTDFDLLAFAQGKSRAKTTVTLYFNEDAANRAQAATALDDSPSPERYVVDREAFDAARAEIKASAVTFHLNGLDEGRIDELREEFHVDAGSEMQMNLTDKNAERYLVAILSEAFEKAVNAEGDENTTKRSVDEWLDFKKVTPSSQWPKLLGGVLDIIFVSYIIDDAVDAGFLADSSDDPSTLK